MAALSLCCAMIMFVSVYATSANAQEVESSFGIYLVRDDKLVLSGKDVKAYFQKTREIQLNKSGIEKWNSYIPYDSSYYPPIPKLGGLYKKEFIVRVDSNEICRGRFWSSASSLSYDGIVLMDVLFRCDSLHDKVRFQCGAPVNSGIKGNCPLSDSSMINFFSARGMLK